MQYFKQKWNWEQSVGKYFLLDFFHYSVIFTREFTFGFLFYSIFPPGTYGFTLLQTLLEVFNLGILQKLINIEKGSDTFTWGLFIYTQIKWSAVSIWKGFFVIPTIEELICLFFSGTYLVTSYTETGFLLLSSLNHLFFQRIVSILSFLFKGVKRFLSYLETKKLVLAEIPIKKCKWYSGLPWNHFDTPMWTQYVTIQCIFTLHSM